MEATISAPYSLYDAGQVMQLNELNYNNQTGGSDHITVEQNGRLHVRLNPTSQSGNARIRIHTLIRNIMKIMMFALQSANGNGSLDLRRGQLL